MKPLESIEALQQFSGLVLFSADWCAPCKTYKPILTAFAQKHGIPLGFVDAGKFPNLAGAYEVRAVPTTFFLVDGQAHTRRQGAQTEAALEALIPYRV